MVSGHLPGLKSGRKMDMVFDQENTLHILLFFTYFGLKLGQDLAGDLENRAAHPHQ